MDIWATMTAFALVAFLFTFGNWVSNKTKAYMSSVNAALIVFLILMYTGLIPANVAEIAGLAGMQATMVIPLCVVDVATKIRLRELLPEWRTVLTVLVSIIGIAAVCLTIGYALLGWERAMSAIAPLAGALLATTIVQQQALAVGDSGIAVYVMIVFLVQVSLGLPIATIALKKYFAELRAKGQLRDVVLLEQNAGAGINAKGVEKKPLIPPTPKDWQCEYTILFKMALVAAIAYFVGEATAIPGSNPKIHILTPTLCYMIFGFIAGEIGFIEREPLEKSNSRGIIYLALLTVVLTTFVGVELKTLLSTIIPAVTIILLGVGGIILCAVIFAKCVKMSPWLAIAIGTTCYLGFPCSQIVVEETVRTSDLTEEEKRAVNAYVIPKMIIGYMSASIFSLLTAGITAPLIF